MNSTTERDNDLPTSNNSTLIEAGFSSHSNQTSTHFTPSTRTLSQSILAPQDKPHYIQFYLCLTIIFNLGFLFWDGNGGDIGFWEDWVKQLSNKGYSDFNGNYPPIYIHWLYAVSQIYNFLHLPIENNLFLKYLTQIPTLLSHLVLVTIVHHILKRFRTNDQHYHLSLSLTALNPAIYLNGPVWGQIDILPLIPVIFSVLASTHQKYRFLTFPLYTLALLTKFQMIAFAPVMGIIFFQHLRTHILGGVLSLFTIALAFTPFIAADHFIKAFKLAYIDVLHQYGATTMGAANIWIILTGNAAPDTTMLFGITKDSALAPFFIAKNFGIICFALVCLTVFIQGLKKITHNTLPVQNPQLIRQLFFYSMICAAAFFTLLPAMHERYLLPATIISLIYFALSHRAIIYPFALTFIAAMNIAMCLGIRTSSVWPAISWLTLLILTYGLFGLGFGQKWEGLFRKALRTLTSFRYLWLIVLLMGISYMGNRLYKETRIETPNLKVNQILLVDIPISYSQQDYGKLNINKSIDGKILSANSRRYKYGLGTHANSTIHYKLPANASTLSASVALDDEVESASVKFLIWGDNKLLWESTTHLGAEEPEFVEVSLKGVRYLRLEVNGINDISGDHANWLNPIITLTPESIPDLTITTETKH